MKTTEVPLPDAVYDQVESLAAELRVTVPQLLCEAAQQMVLRQTPSRPPANGHWQFPEGRRLGTFQARPQDWRLLANEAAD
ncbi:MAG: antitoxin [Verrucomicrobia bacterium]|nr:antitoxin [Verrucomicrobiota bacterium]